MKNCRIKCRHCDIVKYCRKCKNKNKNIQKKYRFSTLPERYRFTDREKYELFGSDKCNTVWRHVAIKHIVYLIINMTWTLAVQTCYGCSSTIQYNQQKELDQPRVHLLINPILTANWILIIPNLNLNLTNLQFLNLSLTSSQQ